MRENATFSLDVKTIKILKDLWLSSGIIRSRAVDIAVRDKYTLQVANKGENAFIMRNKDVNKVVVDKKNRKVERYVRGINRF